MNKTTKKIGTLMLATVMAVSAQVGTMALSAPEATGMEVVEAASTPVKVSLVSDNGTNYKIKFKNISSDDLAMTVRYEAYDANGEVTYTGSDNLGSFAPGEDQVVLYSDRAARKVKLTIIYSQNGHRNTYKKTIRLDR